MCSWSGRLGEERDDTLRWTALRTGWWRTRDGNLLKRPKANGNGMSCWTWLLPVQKQETGLKWLN